MIHINKTSFPFLFLLLSHDNNTNQILKIKTTCTRVYPRKAVQSMLQTTKNEKRFCPKILSCCYIIQTEKKYNNYTITMFYFEDRSNFLIQRIIERNLKLKK